MTEKVKEDREGSMKDVVNTKMLSQKNVTLYVCGSEK